MADVFSSKKRSEIMARVKGRGNSATEVKLVGIFRRLKVRGWRRNIALFGKPDFVFYGERVAIFVDGCFWHRCPKHGSMPKTNRKFWEEKLERNRKRDLLVRRELKKAGWRVIRIWQHELSNPQKVSRKLNRYL